MITVIISLLANNCKFVAYNWLQISCINTFYLTFLVYLFFFLFVTNFNLQTLNALCNFIISVCLMMTVESFVCLYDFLFTLHFMFVNLILCKKVLNRV